MNQQTIKEPIHFKGIGLHTGTICEMRLEPAEVNHGIKFYKKINGKEAKISADVSNIASTERGTVLEDNGEKVHTIEHILSTLYGLMVDNVKIYLSGDEIPILDGSADSYVQKINEVGIVEQDSEREYFEIKELISIKDEESGSEITVIPSDEFELNVMIDFDSEVLHPQMAVYKPGEDDYVRDIAPSRTFVFLHEVEPLLDKGLVKGGDLSNAVVFVEYPLDEEKRNKLAKKLNKDNINVDSKGVLNLSELRFNNEPARHKLLDLMGDLALIGKHLKAKVVAYKPGHSINTRLASKLKKEFIKHRKLKGKPDYDPRATPIYDTERIKATLPHRFPFLLVDKVTEISDTHVVGIKNVSYDQYFFQGHFPDNPVFPGVLQIEAMAQTGGILILSTVEDPSNWDTYFMKIDKVKFKQKVSPGDTLVMKLELLSPIRRGICHMYGKAFVGDKLVSEGELLAQIVRRKDDE